MSRHTPGPWRIAPGYHEGLVIASAEGRELARVHKVATGYDRYGDPLEFDAAPNATLIAAAPEMCAALRVIRQTLEHNSQHIPASHIRQYEIDLKAVIAAIAKAEGR